MILPWLLVGVVPVAVVIGNRIKNAMQDTGWQIGPIVGSPWSFSRVNYSKGVPIHPPKDADGNYYFDIPFEAEGSVHYVTKPETNLNKFSKMRLRYKVEMGTGTQIRPVTAPNSPDSIISLYFQRKGDEKMSGVGKYIYYRWYATPEAQDPITAGEHEIVADLFENNWTPEDNTSLSQSEQLAEFIAAINNSARVGFVLGGGTGYGHGVFATGKARFTILSFTLE